MEYTKEQIKAAYALNLCTVSVSQIIEYEDLQIMEQEYEAILNNLNLEQIPKDEALLKILKQILDTQRSSVRNTSQTSCYTSLQRSILMNLVWRSSRR